MLVGTDTIYRTILQYASLEQGREDASLCEFVHIYPAVCKQISCFTLNPSHLPHSLSSCSLYSPLLVPTYYLVSYSRYPPPSLLAPLHIPLSPLPDARFHGLFNTPLSIKHSVVNDLLVLREHATHRETHRDVCAVAVVLGSHISRS